MSRVFGSLVAARSRLYDAGMLPVRRLSHPVISVGNLTVGGTGKTPVVIALAGLFRDLGYRPVVLSRGYRRSGGGIVVVSRGRGPEVDWKRAGDEPMLMAIRLPGVAVVVGGDRYRAGQRAEAERLGDLFILDDGFQHRRLHRDFDLVTLDAAEWGARDRLLPFGRWREPRRAVHRAHAACVTGLEGGAAPEVGISTFEVETIVDGLVGDGEVLPVETLAGQSIVAFAGIARPGRFFRTLERLGLEPAVRKTFPDHHPYSRRDLETLPTGAWVTTEKDAVRLPAGGFYFLRISAKIRRLDALRDLILTRIAAPAHDT